MFETQEGFETRKRSQWWHSFPDSVRHYRTERRNTRSTYHLLRRILIFRGEISLCSLSLTNREIVTGIREIFLSLCLCCSFISQSSRNQSRGNGRSAQLSLNIRRKKKKKEITELPNATKSFEPNLFENESPLSKSCLGGKEKKKSGALLSFARRRMPHLESYFARWLIQRSEFFPTKRNLHRDLKKCNTLWTNEYFISSIQSLIYWFTVSNKLLYSSWNNPKKSASNTWTKSEKNRGKLGAKQGRGPWTGPGQGPMTHSRNVNNASSPRDTRVAPRNSHPFSLLGPISESRARGVHSEKSAFSANSALTGRLKGRLERGSAQLKANLPECDGSGRASERNIGRPKGTSYEPAHVYLPSRARGSASRWLADDKVIAIRTPSRKNDKWRSVASGCVSFFFFFFF